MRRRRKIFNRKMRKEEKEEKEEKTLNERKSSSSNLGSAPQRRPSTERKAMRTTRVGCSTSSTMYIDIKYCMSARLM